MTCSRAVSSSQNRPRGSATPSVWSTEKVSGRAWIDFASFDAGARPALVHHAADVVLFHRASADRPLHVEQPRFGLAAGEVDGDRAEPRIRHVLGLADRGADRLLGLLEIDDAAAAHAASLLPAEAQHAQRAVAFGAADQAGDLGGADIEHAERPGAPMPRTRRFVRSGRRRRQHATRHVVHVRLSVLRRGGAGRRTTRRSPSTHVDRGKRPIEQRMLLLQAASADRAPATSWPSGSITSAPLLRRRFQRRSPTRTAAMTRFCSSGRSVSASISVAAHRRRARPDDQRKLAELGDVLVRDQSGRCDRSARTCPGSARWRTAGAPAGSTTTVPGSRRSTVACSTHDSVSTRWRACSTRETEDRIALAARRVPRAAAVRVCWRGPSITTSVTRRPAKAVAPPSRSRSVASVPPGAAERTAATTEQHHRMPRRRPSRRDAAGASAGAAAASNRPGRSLTELRGPRVTRGMSRSPPSRRRAAESSCRDAPPVRAAARSA